VTDTAPRRQPGGHPWLDLRDGLAGLVIQGLTDPGAASALETLASHLDALERRGAVPATGDAADRLRVAGILDQEGWLAPEAARRVAYLRDRGERAAVARAAVSTRREGLPGVRAEVVETAALLDAGLFFEAHERLEAEWRRAPLDRRPLYQAIIQVAVALQHLANGNVPGAASLLESAAAKLEGQGAERAGLALDPLREGVRRAIEAVRADATDAASLVPPFAPAGRAG
jgi:hypothetical protein